MNIKDAAERVGLPAKRIRYYEAKGLVELKRTENGHRDFDNRDLQRLVLLKRARSLGLPLKNCRRLLAIFDNRYSSRVEETQFIQKTLEQVDERIGDLQRMSNVLEQLVFKCTGDNKATCQILEDLADKRQD